MKSITLSRAIEILSKASHLHLDGVLWPLSFFLDTEDTEDGSHVFLTIQWEDDEGQSFEVIYRDEDNVVTPKVDGSDLLLVNDDGQEDRITILIPCPASSLEA